MMKAKMDKYLGVAVLGYALLIVGCFLPLVTLEFGGLSEGVTFFDDGGDGVIIFGILLLSLPIVLMARHRLLLIPAVLTFGIVMINFVDIRGDEFIMELANFQWFTWIILFAGSAVLAAGGVMGFMDRGRTSEDLVPAAA